MAIILTPSTHPSRESAAYVIKNPQMTTNAFTVTDASEAAQALKLQDEERISALKDFLKGYDMTSISTDEFKKVGRRLYDEGMISRRAFGLFIAGDGASDVNGYQTKTDVKFNAIALFNEKMQDEIDYRKSEPLRSYREGAMDYLQGMVNANQAINALAYFVNSSSSTLSVNEKA
ncbi:hypothetical protein [Pseudomonas poae]|uniref:DUF1217 domain-containing protein n=1 Tax=Pseudomonas poae TaxID=200451 RepID=A0ABY0RAN5_9PSED|nr:hypothetical protein [Pseudomonas poae]KRP54626.1 hypothetical protein TU75_00890 [Pseudomonas poae]SDN42270.1 hypothetical protein SAMN04490208_0274 [Pseudomonas poae]